MQSVKKPERRMRVVPVLEEKAQTITVALPKSEEMADGIASMRVIQCNYGYGSPHKVGLVKYRDGSIWVGCPFFGWYDLYVQREEPSPNPPKVSKLGCRHREKRCTWFVG